jgi:hypothetical protein
MDESRPAFSQAFRLQAELVERRGSIIVDEYVCSV